MTREEFLRESGQHRFRVAAWLAATTFGAVAGCAIGFPLTDYRSWQANVAGWLFATVGVLCAMAALMIFAPLLYGCITTRRRVLRGTEWPVTDPDRVRYLRAWAKEALGPIPWR